MIDSRDRAMDPAIVHSCVNLRATSSVAQNAGTNDENYLMPLTLQECRFSSNGKASKGSQQNGSATSRNILDLRVGTTLV